MNTVENTPIVGTAAQWFGGLARGGEGNWNLTVVAYLTRREGLPNVWLPAIRYNLYIIEHNNAVNLNRTTDSNNTSIRSSCLRVPAIRCSPHTWAHSPHAPRYNKICCERSLPSLFFLYVLLRNRRRIYLQQMSHHIFPPYITHMIMFSH